MRVTCAYPSLPSPRAQLRTSKFPSFLSISLCLLFLVSKTLAQCPLYTDYSSSRHPPFTNTRWNLSYARPIKDCRTFRSQEVEDTIERLRGVIVDPDLMRVFENTWASTLDTTVGWRGWSNGSEGLGWGDEGKDGKEKDGKEQKHEEEELTFVITGDIEAMWLRDSANQLQAYVSLLKANKSQDSLASVFRGAINLQARYILEAPFCNAFQAPPESGVPSKSSSNSDVITPSFDYMKVFSCNWELDSLASFLQLSDDYATATGDYEFFHKSRNWKKAVKLILETVQSMTIDSYSEDGQWQHTPYTYCAPYGGTPINNCNGSPHRGNIGLIRSFHRPSDDACIYQYLIPSNMMFSRALNATSTIMSHLATFENSPRGVAKGKPGSIPSDKPEPEDKTKEISAKALTSTMRQMSAAIHEAIQKYAIVKDPKYGPIYAYEIDGYGSVILMDDPNIPSLLSAPFLGYLPLSDPVYQNTRRKILSRDNPYYSWGPIITGVGSPHTLPGNVWPMAGIMQILTSGVGTGKDGKGAGDSDEEVFRVLRGLVGSTAGYGLMHESVSSHTEGQFSRSWFSWANGMFGQAILHLEKTRPQILKMGFQ